MSLTLYDYLVQIHDDPDGLWLTCPDIPRTHGVGDDMAGALESLRDGLETVFSFYVEEGLVIPAPSTPSAGQQTVRLPVLASMKAAAWNAFVTSGLSKAELARRLGVARPQVDWLFDFLHDSRSDQLECALAIMGLSVALKVEPVAV